MPGKGQLGLREHLVLTRGRDAATTGDEVGVENLLVVIDEPHPLRLVPVDDAASRPGAIGEGGFGGILDEAAGNVAELLEG